MSADQALRHLLDTLEQAGVAYMIVGSWASSLHGQARATQNVDVVVAMREAQLHDMTQRLEHAFYIPAQAVDALAAARPFNLIHIETALKVDLIPVRPRTFSRLELTRRVAAELLGGKRWFASPEDTILTKLEWVKMGGGARHLEDASGVARVGGKTLDWDYLHHWAGRLGLTDLLKSVEQAIEG